MSSPTIVLPRRARCLAKLITTAKPADIAVVHAHALGGMSGKDALAAVQGFVAKKADYTIIVVRG